MPARRARYALPEPETLDRLPEVLGPAFELAEGSRQRSERLLYDSFDGRIRRSGHTLSHEAGRLVLRDADDELADTGGVRSGDAVLVAGVEDEALRERLAPVLEMRAAVPTVRLRQDRRELRVLDEARKTVVRIAVVEGAAGPDRRALVARLELEAVRGYDKALRRVRRALEDELGLSPQTRTLEDEAVSAVGGRPEGFSSKLAPDLVPDDRADVAARTVLVQLSDTIEANLPGTLADVDTEFVHDLRVAVRRTRALQRELRGVFAPAELRRYRAEFKQLQQITGPVRDLDVQLLEFDEVSALVPAERRAELDALRSVLLLRRRREFARMKRALRSTHTRAVLDGWADAVRDLPGLPLEDRPDAARPVRDVAAERIRHVYRQMVRMGRAIDEDSPAEALHDLRKKGKELRYLLEFFARLFPDEAVTPMVKTLKALQDTLGRFQDREIQAGVLRGLGPEIAALDDGAATLMAMGVLAERLEEQQAHAHEEFGERFAPFAAKARRAAVQETFG